MSDAPLHLTLVTLGVKDVAASTRFYEAMGLKRASMSNESVSFFDMGGVALGLFGRNSLAEDAGLSYEGTGFRAVSLAWNRPSPEDVEEAIDRAVQSGGTRVKAAEKVFWGGYSGYFADPDGHLWEVAHNPFAPLRENGSMELS
jgi:predicted lactoylglutathione lyase